jgi:Cu(I)/Ag(I) efflux system membrane protein CusA/SilA
MGRYCHQNYNSVPVRVKDIGSVQMGGDLSRDFDANGEGEVVGGMMRYGENADKVIDAVKVK